MKNLKNNSKPSASISLAVVTLLVGLSSCKKQLEEKTKSDRPTTEEIAEIRREVKEESERFEKESKERSERLKKRLE